MLSEDHCSALRQVAQRAVLAPHQTDDLLQAAWGSQGKTCPYCREEMPWHRGVLLQNGHQVAWICMLCGLLEIGATKKFLPRAIGKLPTERGLPLPPGFALVWISTEMLPGEGSPSRWRAVDVARLLGHEIGERISAAILEDPRAARLSRPGYFDAADSPWRPLLLEEAWAQPKKGQRLLDYVSTMMETSTSNHVHNVNGLEWDELETITSTHRPDLNDALPVLSEEVLYAIPTMSSEMRRTRIPRIGLTPQTCWETVRSEVEHGLASVALSTPYDDDLQLYLIPFHACTDFYWPGLNQPELTDPRIYISEVGFDFAPEIDPKKVQERSLWEAVFGEALIPEGSREIAPQKESAEAIRSDPQA